MAPKTKSSDAVDETEVSDIVESADDSVEEVPTQEVLDADSKDADDKVTEVADESAHIDTVPDVRPEPTSKHSGIFLPAVFGGVIAAATGFGISQFMGNDSWPFSRGTSELDMLQEMVDSQSGRIVQLSAEIADLQGQLANLPPDPRIEELDTKQGGLQAGLEELGGRTTTAERRILDLENRPVPDVGATLQAVEAYETQLTGMRAMLSDELQRIENAQSEALKRQFSASSLEESSAVRSALVNIETAIGNGSPFEVPLDQLRGLNVEVPAELTALAASGVPTLGSLQEAFPGGARSALDAVVREDIAAGRMGKLAGFMKIQLGTRSLQPREGDDPDAILSRAENYLRSGNIEAALLEVESLPEVGRNEMSSWVSMARSRQTALSEVAELASKNSG